MSGQSVRGRWGLFDDESKGGPTLTRGTRIHLRRKIYWSRREMDAYANFLAAFNRLDLARGTRPVEVTYHNVESGPGNAGNRELRHCAECAGRVRAMVELSVPERTLLYYVFFLFYLNFLLSQSFPLQR